MFSHTPIGSFFYDDLEQIVTMINFLTSAQWVYERDEKNEANTHFKLGRGFLDLETVATVSSQGAVIDVSGNTFRIFKINKALLEKNYCKSYQEFKYNKYLKVRFHMDIRENADSCDEKAADIESPETQVSNQAGYCNLM